MLKNFNKDYRYTNNLLNNQNYIINESKKIDLVTDFLLKWESNNFFITYLVLFFNKILFSYLIKSTRLNIKNIFFIFNIILFLIFLPLVLYIYWTDSFLWVFNYTFIFIFWLYFFINYKVINLLNDYFITDVFVLWFRKRYSYYNSLILDYNISDDFFKNNFKAFVYSLLYTFVFYSLYLYIGFIIKIYA